MMDRRTVRWMEAFTVSPSVFLIKCGDITAEGITKHTHTQKKCVR